MSGITLLIYPVSLYLFTASHSGFEKAASLGFLLSSSFSGGRDGARPCKTRLGPSSFLVPRGRAGVESADPGIGVQGGVGGWGEEGRREASQAQLPSAPADWAPATPLLGSVPSSPVAPCSLRGEAPAARSLGLGVCGCCVLAELQMGVGIPSPTHWALNEHLLRAA